MSQSCPACYQNQCPEAVSTITVNQTTLTMNGALVGWRDEYFTTASPKYDATSKTITLTYMPVNPGSVLLSLNSGVQGQDTSGTAANFSVSGNIVSLNFTPAATDVIHVHYFGYSGELSSYESVGFIKGYEGSVVPAGYLKMDGTTSHLIADYPELYAHGLANSLLLTYDATSFTLKEVKITYEVGGVETLGYACIKT